MDILTLPRDGAIIIDDLIGFSDDFVESIKYFLLR